MKRKLTVIHTDGRPPTVTIEADPSLARLQGIVGGYIQILPGFRTFQGKEVLFAFCNENGRIENLPFNGQASEYWAKCFTSEEIDVERARLYGDVLIIQTVPRENS